MFYYVENHSAPLAHEFPNPWDHDYPRPPFTSKEEFRHWCIQETTHHCFFSAVEGAQPRSRLNSETNPPVRLHGLVLDYDADPGPHPEVQILNNAPPGLAPAWYYRTFSGNMRLVYVFQSPIGLINPEFNNALIRLLKARLRLLRLGPGFEAEALIDLCKYYEIGGEWQPINGGTSRIPTHLLNGWLYDVSGNHDWTTNGVSVPLNVVREECARRWPDRWPNGWENFDLRARGPRFWDPDANDDTAAIVRETGMQFFSDGGGWRSWASLLGQQWMRQWQDDRIGSAVTNVWSDLPHYWRKIPQGDWKRISKDDLRLFLHTECGLKPTPDKKDQPTEVNRAIMYVQNFNSVKGAMPHVYRADGPTTFNGSRYLNTSTLRVMEPRPEIVAWGENFPWLADFFDNLFEEIEGPVEQRDYFLAWLKYFYVSARGLDPQRGQAMVLAGPAGGGKTLLGAAIIGQLMGRTADASKYLVEGDQYNDLLFEAPVWTVDDAIVSGDYTQRARYSQVLKQVIANDKLVFRAMYASGRTSEWLGRPFITMNDDPESMMMLPLADIQVFDKIIVLKTQNPQMPYYPTDAAIAAELPFFAAWLRDWTPPAGLAYGQGRFGLRAYAHPELVRAALSTSPTASFEEVLADWRREWFAPGGGGERDSEWIGNPSSLQRVMYMNEFLRPNLKNFQTPVLIGMHLNKLVKQSPTFVFSGGDHRQYRITRP